MPEFPVPALQSITPLPENPTYIQWSQYLHDIIAVKDNVSSFAIGDALLMGEVLFPACYSQALGARTGAYAPSTLRQFRWVAMKFPLDSDTRDPQVHWSVYVAIAGIPDDAERWLLAQKAAELGWDGPEAAHQRAELEGRTSEPERVPEAEPEAGDLEKPPEPIAKMVTYDEREWSACRESARVLLTRNFVPDRDEHLARIARFFDIETF